MNISQAAHGLKLKCPTSSGALSPPDGTLRGQSQIGDLDTGSEQDFLRQVAFRHADLILNQVDQPQRGFGGNDGGF
jgi:hypothetical protein